MMKIHSNLPIILYYDFNTKWIKKTKTKIGTTSVLTLSDFIHVEMNEKYNSMYTARSCAG